MVALGVCAAALLASSMGDHSIMAQSSRRISLIGMGAAAESANDSEQPPFIAQMPPYRNDSLQSERFPGPDALVRNYDVSGGGGGIDGVFRRGQSFLSVKHVHTRHAREFSRLRAVLIQNTVPFLRPVEHVRADPRHFPCSWPFAVAVLNALGKVEGDTEKDTKKATEEAVKKAEEETAAAVKAEIDEAVTKGETEGKGACRPFPTEIAREVAGTMGGTMGSSANHLNRTFSTLYLRFLPSPWPPGEPLFHVFVPALCVLGTTDRPVLAAGYAADIEKYKGQEASMGHKGWVDVYANSMREAGLSVKGVAGRAAALQQLAAAQAGSKGAKGRK